MRRTLFILFVFLTAVCKIISQEITNVRFEQNGNMINIYYDLSGPDEYEVKVYCSHDGGNTWGLPLSILTGDIGKGQKQGKSKKIIWNVLEENGNLEGIVTLKVEANSYEFFGSSGTFTDYRDGQFYKWVKIGDQIWMAENLNYQTPSGCWCYDKDSSQCMTYGRYYNWKSASLACPPKWHLPSDQEWEILTAYLHDDIGNKMKENGNDLWSYHSSEVTESITNLSGFTALPAGRYNHTSIDGSRLCAFFWSSSEYGEYKASAFILVHYNNGYYIIPDEKDLGFSVRCLKDSCELNYWNEDLIK